jgi:hypothetical protein
MRVSFLGQDVALVPSSVTLLQLFFAHFYFRLKLYNEFQKSICNKVSLSEHFNFVILVCDVLYVVTSVMIPCNDPGYD